MSEHWDEKDLEKFKQIHYFFYPKSIALIGAGKANPLTVANIILSNILSQQYTGSVYLVDIKPEKETIRGLNVYHSISKVPEIDLALIMVPASAVPVVIEECIETSVKAIIVITAGFSESSQYDKNGIELQAKIENYAKKSKIRIAGPNCNGVYSQDISLNATLGPRVIVPPGGNLSLVTRGGTAGIILGVAGARKRIGLNKCIGIGDECDLKLQDFIHYYEHDAKTKIIGAYTEGIKDPKSFMRILRSVKKPLILYKTGETFAGAKAAASHVAAIAGEHTSEIFEGVLKQLKVIKVEDADEFMDIADALSISPLPKGKNIGIWTPGGSMGVMMSDELEKEGLIIPKLHDRQIEKLHEIIKVKYWSHDNPVDVTDSITSLSIDKTVEVLLSAKNIDGIVVLFGSLLSEKPEYIDFSFRKEYEGLFDSVLKQQARKFGKLIKKYQKPIFLLGEDKGEFGKVFQEKGVVVLPSFRRIARTFRLMNMRYNYLKK